MCFEDNILQQVIDGEYRDDASKVYKHMEQCQKCRKAFARLKASEEFIRQRLEQDMAVPPVREFKNESLLSKKVYRRKGVIYMNTPLKRITAAAAAVAVCAGLLSFQPVRTYASEFLKIFRANEVQGISITQQDLSQIEKVFRDGQGKVDVENLISMEVSSESKGFTAKNITDFNEIKQKAPSAKLVKLPPEFQYESFGTQPETDMIMTLHVEKINDLLTYLGEETRLPQELNGKKFHIRTGNVVQYQVSNSKEQGNDNEEYKGFSLVQMDTPTLEIPDGVDAQELIDALFALQILPDNVRKQLQGISDISSTLPIPYDAEKQEKIEVTIQGQHGIALKSEDEKYDRCDVVFKEGNQLYFAGGRGVTLEVLLQILETLE
ncbi:hypothetical protein [Petroclostridium sp. X23]|uniref:anti-sigma factor family protein n=1 Tax=Petroclostridium sp. X23 TaxID=3045146 RepID=UPI0024ADE602|nr:hypothetical protein [Petroclostridium sp. X23]WHH57910.1 hypothetical protein QKW49_19155 [Petroclostridium sp. X23]